MTSPRWCCGLPADARPIHLVGVGGAGMSGLARLALAAGYAVSGSDREESATLAVLRELGVRASVGHDSDNLPEDARTVVVSTAIARDNPEVLAARERAIPVIHRADLLAELMGARGIAVAGAHGKSTTSGMLAAAVPDASACVGATIDGGEGTGSRWGPGEWFIAEADESDRSLLKLRPQGAVLLNIDLDHHTTFADIGAVEEIFREFVGRLPSDGVLVIGPDARALDVADAAPCQVRAIDVSDDPWAELEMRGPGEFELCCADGREQVFRLAVPGRHNGENAAAALAIADWCGVPLADAAARLENFGGVGRRFETRGVRGGVRVVDDYAHHPAEVAATLAAAREVADGRVVVVFQPHLFSRTKALAAEFATALSSADLVVVTDVYGAREPDDPTVTGALIADAIAGGQHVPSLDAVPDLLCPQLRSGDLVITMGAGDVTNVAGSLLAGIEVDHDDGQRHAGSS